MKKTALFLSMFAIAHSLCALNVIHKESETSPAFVKLIDINHDGYQNKSSYATTYNGVEGLNLLFNSEFYYYKLSIENGSEDKIVIYHAQDQIKDSIIEVKKLIHAKAQILMLGSVASYLLAHAGIDSLRGKTRSAFNDAVAICAISALVASLAMLFAAQPMINLDYRVKDSLEVEKAFEMKEGWINIKTSSQNGKGSIIIVSDHELQTVEIDIQQRNEAYYEVTLTEITA